MDKKEFEKMQEKMKEIIEQVNLLSDTMEEVCEFLKAAKPMLENSVQITPISVPKKQKF